MNDRGSFAKDGTARDPGAVRHDSQDTRLNIILTELQNSGSVSVKKMSKELGVSLVTTRRDIDELESRGLLRRTHGGAVPIEPFFYEPFRNDRSFQAQVTKFADEKRRIGRAAASLIAEGETIALTPGTTTTEVIRGIPLNRRIMVVTSTVNVAMELSKRKDVEVFVTGGLLHGDWFSLVGPAAVESLSHVVIHTLFIGADGIDAIHGASCFSAEDFQIASVMAKIARRRIAVVDHSKFGVAGNWKICELSDIQLIVTDTGATDELIAPFDTTQTQVRRV